MQRPPSLDQTAAGWDGAATHYEDNVERVTSRFVEAMLDHANVTSGTELLDIASGAGTVAISAAKRGASVLATDFSPKMVERLRQRAGEEGSGNIRAAVMDAQDLGISDAGHDAVTCNFGVMFFADVERALAEMYRVLRPGGTAVVTTWSPMPQQGLGRLMRSVVQTVLPDYRPSETETSLAMDNPQRVAEALTYAGFNDVVVHTIAEVWVLPHAASIRNLITTNPAMDTMLRQITQERKQALLDTAERLLVEQFGDRQPELPMEALMAVARKAE